MITRTRFAVFTLVALGVASAPWWLPPRVATVESQRAARPDVSRFSRPPAGAVTPESAHRIEVTTAHAALPPDPHALSRAVAQRVRESPSDAVSWVEEQMREDPRRAAEYAAALVFALGLAGQHERASSFAAAAPEAMRVDLLTAAYRTWAEDAPEVALDTALGLDDPARRRAAFQAAISGWSRAAPEEAVACAAAFPAGPEKRFALITALRAWRSADPLAVQRWLSAPGHELGEADLRVVWDD